MSEMSAEKKKEIEKYIIESYFGHYKNVKPVKPYIGGVDLISGFCDIPDLLVEVEFFNSEMIIVRWNVRSESVSVWKNEFIMRVCRERKIERNRCDSVDAMSYAWEAWKSKIQGKPIFLKTNDEDLQKDKHIEELEREVKALKAENEVMDRHIRELESHNVSLAETNAVLNNKLNEFDPLPEFREILKKLYSTNDIENLEWTLNHVCGGRGSVNGWIAVSLFWKQKYETISKLVGFMTVEEIQDYLSNEDECATLQEALARLKDQVKYTCDKWYSANSSNNSWKAAAECNSPKELIEKRETLKKEIEVYSRALKEWKKITGCPSPSAAKTLIESCKRDIEKWQTMAKECENSYKNLLGKTGFYNLADLMCYLPEDKTFKDLIDAYEKDYISLRDEHHIAKATIREWKDATGCDSAEAAGQYIGRLKARINKIHDCAVDW